MPTYEVTSPTGKVYEVNAPEGASQADVFSYAQSQFGNDNSPAEEKSPSFLSRVGSDLNERGNQLDTIVNAASSGQQGLGVSALQAFGNVGLGGLGDIASQAVSSLIPQGVKDVAAKGLEYAVNTPLAQYGGEKINPAYGMYEDFREANPSAARTIDAVGNIAMAGANASPLRSAIGAVEGAIPAIRNTAANVLEGAASRVTSPLSAVSDAASNPLRTVLQAGQSINNGIDNVAGAISQKINRATLPEDLQSLPNADALFLRSLQQENISPLQAIADYENAANVGASPSVAVTSNVPSMQTQAYLTARGSAGSRVAADAVKDISENQIPKLNTSLIEKATGGKVQDAESYGNIVSQEAKTLVDKKINTLKTRAKPYYQASIGLDKSIDETSDAFKKALGNRKVVEALDNARKDVNTITNVQAELADLGIDAADIEKLPINSTISMHAARVNLREQADKAFRSGDTGVYKAAKNALTDIDNAIESQFPEYKTARRIYSEDAGALKTLKDSPVGKMSTMADGNYSTIANDLMTRDKSYINKFVSSLDKSGADKQKIRDGLAGAFLKRQLEESAKDGARFSDKVFRSEGTSERLKSLVGEDRFNQMKKVDGVIDQLLATRSIPSQSITAAATSVRDGVGEIPLSLSGVVDAVRKKIAPSLFDLVQRDPAAAARYNQLLFTDEGYKLLKKVSASKKPTPNDIRAVGKFINNSEGITE